MFPRCHDIFLVWMCVTLVGLSARPMNGMFRGCLIASYIDKTLLEYNRNSK